MSFQEELWSVWAFARLSSHMGSLEVGAARWKGTMAGGYMGVFAASTNDSSVPLYFQ